MKTALVVDDSKVVRTVCRRIMEALEYSVEEAENGEEALKACQQSLPQVVLLDWNMPVMNGLEFLKELRQLPGNEETKVIFCTTENELEKIQEGMAAGANEYVMKPFDEEIIRGKLSQLGLN